MGISPRQSSEDSRLSPSADRVTLWSRAIPRAGGAALREHTSGNRFEGILPVTDPSRARTEVGGDAVRSRTRRWVLGLTACGLFLLSVRALGIASGEMRSALGNVLPILAQGPRSALGIGWLATYLVLNGSVVAAVTVALGASDVLAIPEVFMSVTGSRLGAASFVVVVGALHHFQHPSVRVRRSMELGLLTFLVTHSVYLPTGLLGHFLLPVVAEPLAGMAASLRPLPIPEHLGRGVVTPVLALVGPGGLFLLAVAILFLSVHLFDRALAGVDVAGLRQRYLRRRPRRWSLFAIGLLATVATASVAFSVGVIVPLYNQGQVQRRDAIPYLLGANVGTLADTLLVAMVLDFPAGAAALLLLITLALGLSLVLLMWYDRYFHLVERGLHHLTASRLRFVAGALLLLAAPVLLVAL